MKQKYIIETKGINYGCSNYEKIPQDINIKVETGTIYGFLGPKGSGETTTLSLILRCTAPCFSDSC